MAGSKGGGLKAAETNKKLYGKDFYQKIGTIGGKKSRGGGFTKTSRRAQIAGMIGGLGGWDKLPKDKQEELRKEIIKIRGYKDDYR